MAGANGPTSAAGTPDIPNPLGGADAGQEARPDVAPVKVERPADGAEADGARADGGAAQDEGARG